MTDESQGWVVEQISDKIVDTIKASVESMSRQQIGDPYLLTANAAKACLGVACTFYGIVFGLDGAACKTLVRQCMAIWKQAAIDNGVEIKD